MNIGDSVVRKKYGKDIVFIIYKLEDGIAYLKGKEIRLLADSELDDLELADETYQRSMFDFDDSDLFQRESFLKGRVLHIDGDSSYLQMCLEKYKQFGIQVDGYHMPEKEMKDRIVDLLIKHRPDILVITGHDGFRGNQNEAHNINVYSHSRDYIETLKRARSYQPDRDTLVIFAGACQSHYEALIANGANFASSPERVNIHALDPVYIVSQIASTHVTRYMDVVNTIRYTSAKEKGIGGVDTKGVARRIFPER